MKDNKAVTDKRALLIDAIVKQDTQKLQELSQPGKRIIVLDTFLDLLIWSTNGGFEDNSIIFICTDNYKKMWEEIEARSSPANTSFATKF